MIHRSFDNVIFFNFQNETRFSIEFMSGETYKTDKMRKDNFQRDSQGIGFGVQKRTGRTPDDDEIRPACPVFGQSFWFSFVSKI